MHKLLNVLGNETFIRDRSQDVFAAILGYSFMLRLRQIDISFM